MAEFEYGGGGEDLGTTQPFETDYSGYDPRLPSQRFDSSQRFDESFRAPDHFAPTFADDVKEEDEYKSANGFGYHPADAPPTYGYEDDLSGGHTDAPAPYAATFEPDPSNEFGGEVNYSSAPPVSGNGFDAHEESLFTGAGNGPTLPDPEEMREEGSKLREWKRLNAIRLEEKERKERDMLDQLVADADYHKDQVYEKRKNTMENGRKTNRDKEKVFLTNQENFHKNADKQYWKAVAELIPNELPTIDTKAPTKKDKKDKDRKPSIVALKGPKPGKPTDVTRMRQILVKLKHNPPPHMKPKPPPAPEKEKDAKAKDGKDAKDAKDAKDPKDKDVKDKDVKDTDSKEKSDAATEPAEGAAAPAAAADEQSPVETPAPVAAAAAVTA
ncbi:hypothetical protein R1sor_020632 [Riccia sorocarpa]|uniref:Clathrin light chain n=1 Tax=Riccia sorocarpa TaxID=122646 RepID=A0ABD3GG70_9MARC